MSILSQKLKNSPHQPGCYLFKNRPGKIIYIGKAKDLKKRVSSYFRKNLEYKTQKLSEEIFDVDFFVTDSEVEALLLEAKLIKENQPKYNLELKGGVRYAYIKITSEQFPRLETVRLFKRQDKIFGPFAIADNRKSLISLANELFKLRTSKERVVKIAQRYRIRCSVPPFIRLTTPEEYQKDVEKAALLLAGKMDHLISSLQAEMRQYSGQNNFELAKLRRDQIKALVQLSEKQKIERRKNYDQDVINFLISLNKFVVQLFNINKGVVSGRKEFRFPLAKVNADPSVALADFISQYYYSNEIPQEIIIPQKVKNQKALGVYLTKLAGRKTELTVPQKGDKVLLLGLVKKNLVSALKRGDSALAELQDKLSLPAFPSVIECFDVSNLGANQIVGSMVYFKDGRPDKNNYRRFKIKWPAYVPTASGLRRVNNAQKQQQSDFDAMHEIVYRRYARLVTEKTALPNLVLIDGGKPQLSAARQALKQLGLQIPLAALAKKQEELYLPGRSFSLRLNRTSGALKLVQRIRDEAHRFAIGYHRLLRSKDAI
ncbi:MAG: excinuclease ABC subunit C [Candidatus Buchananbacteria bacterium RIFCSPLOWO2_01_FULL_46_12]|uniref:Excinuclease ABC subunit C n=1 Tax=Candidatus Buchananbacteria bacterium RIFCSPLOWO2_01_FULL_46_12 TaxID=1797546 RepID=A0A1G1YMS1_9BACT|nr:MAG: excinuclease ABC subunit C [Candidatus Buchananbacteria bacterium RIFCSPLOWO2_01_FULL_46_12]